MAGFAGDSLQRVAVGDVAVFGPNGTQNSVRQTQGVAKRSIVGATVVALQEDRLRFASGLELGKALVDELVNFRMKPATANDPVEAMREGANGDLVFAVALGVWWADRLGWNEEVAERMQARTSKVDWGWELRRNSTTGY